MLRLLFYLSAVITLPGVAAVRTDSSSVFNISSCPIMFYGQKYEEVYVNLTSENIVICFNGFYSPQSRGDCLLGPKVEKAYFEVHERSSLLEERVHENVRDIKTSMNCYVYFELWREESVAQLSITSFERQAALKLNLFLSDTVDVDVLVDNNSVDALTVTNPSDYVYNVAYTDISGCRDSGLAYKAGTVVNSVPETCLSFICSETAVLQNSTCGPLERCQGNGSCFLDAICTVTGPTVIDFFGHLDFVKDRCVYSLLNIPSVSDFQVLAKFQERRRKDVSFLDSVTLEVNGTHIHLKQGGIVLVEDTPLNLNSSAQVVHGLQLSKDQTGVTAMLQIDDLKITIFFDGYTGQILVEGPAGPSLQGLCQNSSEPRLPEYSSTSCETQYNDTEDHFINCTKITERCNLLKEAPFTSCPIDPEPYITACTDTLCKYPAVDGLKCQFLEAYVKACSLFSNTTLEDWRSKAECPSPEAFCQEMTCSDHEFCGEKNDCEETRCFCRPIFASKYRERNTLGDPTVCRRNTASLTLAGCLLEDKGIDYTFLHLNDPTCRGQMNERTHMVTFCFRSKRCGTEVSVNNSRIIYKNTITNKNSFSDMIVRQNQVKIEFSCYLNQPGIKSMALRYKDVMMPESHSSSTPSLQHSTRLKQS
ncbi:uncharacterized protein LOC108250204 [Kryptolebias marmoratus]|uniref:Uncharacterized LOC108250204 n=1 Tax=Kryptolebias marmoratus TaxID=37003 RepID=A0A3Q3BCB4_KRYMA|nr:uncharacterized protein LOC108250204 [Kryptolebias marmoratus]